ncbi:hypothetical protein KBA41_11205 [Candidatus Ozemobacteraceae bacterium]|nr:hypothetical protein [Candidatus Ozemobacteraceae bacterium]
MKNLLVLCLALFLSASAACAQSDLAPAYEKTFGNGIVLVSQSGMPARGKFDPAQFDYRDGKFFIPSGATAEFNVRTILPKGVTLGAALEKLKKEQSQNLKHHKTDYCVWKVWSSHEGGTLRANIKWPASLKDEPNWASPLEGFTSLDPEVYDWTAPGASYEGDFRTAFWSMMAASQPGEKLYVTFHVCFEYQVPGGQVESKWNSDKNKFEDVVSNGMIAYAYSEPLAASTVEFK